MRKFYYGFFLLCFLIPQSAKALLIVPSATIIIVVNTDGGDDAFNFQLTDGQLFSTIQNFNINTSNGSGTYTTTVGFPTSSGYDLTEEVMSGWQLSGAFCISGNPSNSSSSLLNGLHLIVSAFTTTTCTFTNTKFTSRNPVLFIPGITGTEIYKSQSQLWPDALRMTTDIGDQFMDPLGFQSDLSPLDTSLSLGNVVKKVVSFNYTEDFINEFKAHGYAEGIDLFTFPYDWRFGTDDQNIQALKDKINDILSAMHAEKVDVVAHSAGGILLKDYILQNTDHHIGKAVFLGVPNLGAPMAIKTFLEGDNLGIPVLSSAEIKKISHNMPAMYQLTPSGQYQNIVGPFFSIHTQNLLSSSDHDLGFAEMQNYLAGSKGLNAAGFAAANSLHSQSFDTAEVSSKGVDVYNIVGCQQPTVGKIIERRTDNPVLSLVVNGYAIKFVPGDGTVPLASAESISAGNQTYYALNSNHGKMPSQDGIRQEIVKIITQDQSIQVSGVTQDRSACKFNGKAISIYSPLAISATDASGNVTTVSSSGDVQTDIPGSNLEVLGDHKFLFLPDGQDYSIGVSGTGQGSFTLFDEAIVDGETQQRQVFADVPVTSSLKGSLDLGSTASLNLDSNGDGVTDKVLAPSYVINQAQLNDTLPPITQANAMGAQGQSGNFRTDVSITLTASDSGLPSASGLLKTQYILDNGELLAYSKPIVSSQEGKHTLVYFSTDNAGNVEPAKTLNFTIDKTAPEFSIQFNPNIKDIEFKGKDNISSQVLVIDQDDQVTLKDEAGNITKLVLKEKDRKHKLKAEIKRLFYNAVEAEASKNLMSFDWKYTKDGSLKSLSQQVKSKKDFNVDAEYNGSKTTITGKDASGKIKQTFNGLKLLNIQTDKGDLNFSY